MHLWFLGESTIESFPLSRVRIYGGFYLLESKIPINFNARYDSGSTERTSCACVCMCVCVRFIESWIAILFRESLFFSVNILELEFGKIPAISRTEEDRPRRTYATRLWFLDQRTWTTTTSEWTLLVLFSAVEYRAEAHDDNFWWNSWAGCEADCLKEPESSKYSLIYILAFYPSANLQAESTRGYSCSVGCYGSVLWFLIQYLERWIH